MYLDVFMIEATNTAIKLAMDDNENYYLIISKYPYSDIRPLGKDFFIARVEFEKAKEFYKKNSIVY